MTTETNTRVDRLERRRAAVLSNGRDWRCRLHGGTNRGKTARPSKVKK